MHWFKRHPEFLREEIANLAKDGNYKQLFQFRNNLFLSHGLILLRLQTIHRLPILIVYSEATPFELPIIFILKDRLDETFAEELSRLQLYEVYGRIKPHIKFYYELRHQNSTGALCILEWDNLDNGTQYLGITTVLKRVRDWFAGTMTGVFPPDSQEIEFAAHFNDLENHTRFIYPETFLDAGLTCGEAYAQLYTMLPKLPEAIDEYRIYVGCLVIGEDDSGVVKSINFEAAALFKDEGIASPYELYTKQDLLQRKLDNKEWIKCFWFQVGSTPTPFHTIEELTLIIGDGDRIAGVNSMHRLIYTALKMKPDYFFIGLRFPNKRGELEFQLFKIYKNSVAQPVILAGTTAEIMEAFLSSYTRVSAIESEKLTEASFHLRNSGRAEREKLAGSVVNVIGTGAVGSEVADIINKAGPGILCLFDNQRMKAHNAVRHLAGINQIGLPKVIAVAQSLRQHNPFVQVEVFMNDINRIPIEDYLLDKSVSVSSIADDNVEAYLNERAVLAGKTVFYMRALRGGKVARIFRVIPGKDACLQCLNLYRSDGNGPFVDIPEDETLPTLKNECNNPIRPASAADLKLIAAIGSNLIIEQLQNGPAAENHWIWTTEQLETTPVLSAWQLSGQTIEPHPQCVYCHHDHKLSVSFSSSALTEMQALVNEDRGSETGGVLAGLVGEDGNLQVQYASGPGPNAVRTSKKFEKDVPYCQEFLDKLYTEFGAVYLGEWHSHPSEDNSPSGTDIKSLSEIAIQQEYLTEKPLMVILSKTGKPSFSIHPANKVYYHIDASII